jgi:hypothetical protein
MAEPAPETTRPGANRRPQAVAAFCLASAAAVSAALMKGTVAGESQLAAAAQSGNSPAILAATLGFATVVLLGLGAVLIAVDPIVTNRGRSLGIVAIAVAFGSPLIGSLWYGAFSLLTDR